MMSPVLFSDGVRELVRPSGCPTDGKGTPDANKVDMMIEIGPHSTLAGPIDQTLSEYGLGNMEYR